MQNAASASTSRMSARSSACMLATASQRVSVWKPFQSTKESLEIRDREQAISSVTWTRNNRVVISVRKDGNVALGVLSGKIIGTPFSLEPQKRPLYTVAISPSSFLLAAGGAQASVYIYDLKARKLFTSIDVASGPVVALDWSQDGRRLAVGTEGGEILVYAPEASPPTLAARGVTGEYPVRCLQFLQPAASEAHKAQRLCFATDGGGVGVFDASSGSFTARFPDAHRAPATGVAFSDTRGRFVVSCGLDARVAMFDTLLGRATRGWEAPEPLSALDVSGDEFMACGSVSGRVHVWDLQRTPRAADDAPVLSFTAHTTEVRTLRWSYTDAATPTPAPPGSGLGAAPPTVRPRQVAQPASNLRPGAAARLAAKSSRGLLSEQVATPPHNAALGEKPSESHAPEPAPEPEPTPSPTPTPTPSPNLPRSPVRPRSPSPAPAPSPSPTQRAELRRIPAAPASVSVGMQTDAAPATAQAAAPLPPPQLPLPSGDTAPIVESLRALHLEVVRQGFEASCALEGAMETLGARMDRLEALVTSIVMELPSQRDAPFSLLSDPGAAPRQ